MISLPPTPVDHRIRAAAASLHRARVFHAFIASLLVTSLCIAAGPSSRPAGTPEQLLILGPREVVDLPAPVDEVVVGGGGRYLVLEFRRSRQVLVFDVVTRKFTATIECSSSLFEAAASMDKLVVYSAGDHRLARYRLDTGAEELATRTTDELDVDYILMGAASHGPLISISRGNKGAILDLDTLQPVPSAKSDGVYSARLSNRKGISISANGRILSQRSGAVTVSREAGFTQLLSDRTASVTYLPSADGLWLYAFGSVANATSMDIAVRSVYGRLEHEKDLQSQILIPCAHPAFFLGITGSLQSPQSSPWIVPIGPIIVYEASSLTPLVTFPDLPELRFLFPQRTMMSRPRESAAPALQDRIHLMAQHNVLVTLPQTDDKLFVRPCDFAGSVRASDADYFHYHSVPPTDAVRGQPWTYQLQARTRRGGLRFTLDAGPAGMTLSPTGLLEWTPSDKDDNEVSVIVSAHDAGGRRLPQGFVIEVVKPAPPR